MSNQIPDHYEDVGPGWRDILRRLHSEIVVRDPDYKVFQVKEKFGGLRVYLYGMPSDAVRNLIAEAEFRSERTCEECAGGAQLVCVRGWWRALCRTHELDALEVEKF